MVSPVAHAAWPDDIVLSGMGSYNDSVVDASVASAAYAYLVNEMGMSIANKPLSPAETLGVNGFDVGFNSSFSFVHARQGDDSDATPWQRAHADNDPSAVVWIPSLTARKGLPGSIEVGTNLGYVGFSRQGVMGGFGRIGLVEGYRKLPDVAVQAGYSGYFGNPELELGVMDLSLSVGYTVGFGLISGINQATFSPFGGIGSLRIHAAPVLAEADIESLGLERVSGFAGSDYYDESYQHTVFHAGFVLVHDAVQFRMAGQFVLDGVSSMNVGLGFNY
jgi:hypothetical protein